MFGCSRVIAHSFVRRNIILSPAILKYTKMPAAKIAKQVADPDGPLCLFLLLLTDGRTHGRTDRRTHTLIIVHICGSCNSLSVY